jgi:dTDP-4-dehydrorhamnose reductase
MKILITGGNGQIAYDLIRLAKQKKHHVLAPGRDVLDITNAEAVKQLIETFYPDVVINTAAYTKVDQAEKETELAYAVNRDGAKNVAIACAAIDRPLLHLSTDYVFDGEKFSPYTETDKPAPVNIYGNSKLQGEEAVRMHCEQHIIFRVSGVFGSHGVNFVKTILRLAKEKQELKMIADQMICPTPAAAIAGALLKLTTFSRWGTYHFCGDQAVTWHDFAVNIIEKAKIFSKLKVKDIIAITTAEYSALAKRPHYSVLNCERLEKLAGIKRPNLEKGLNDVLAILQTA